MLDGKIAWLTGAGSGIGQAAALELARAGATVIVSGRRESMLGETARIVEAAGGAIEREPLDVGDRAAAARVGAGIVERHGRIDILVNCAGLNVPKRYFQDLTAEDFDRVVRINLNGSLYCMLAALPSMRAQNDGLVVNVASWLGRWPAYLGGAGYASSKHALAALTHQLNIEEGVNGIRGCVIYPGEVATLILATRPKPPPPAEIEKMLRPEDLGRTIRFVAEAPAHVCFNEIVISPTWNRLILGAEDLKLAPERPV